MEQPLIIDVGSNHGQSIDFFLTINEKSKVIGFEPNKSLYEKLIKKYASNKNISIQNMGVSNIQGELLFKENILDLTSTFESVDSNSSYLKMKANVLGIKPNELILQEYNVPVLSLSFFFKENKIKQVDVLKIDVEGHEFKCMEGLFYQTEKLPHIKYIQYEMHKDDMYASQNENKISNLLIQNNYIEVKKIKHGFGDFYEIIYENQNN